MNVTRRGLLAGAAGVAGMAALAPVARALPKAHGTVLLAPIQFETYSRMVSVETQETEGGMKVGRWKYTAMWALKPFPRGFEVEYLTPVWVDREFTEREQPGTDGGVQGQVPNVYRFWLMDAETWVVEIELEEYGNELPSDRPLWVHAEGVVWR